MLGIIPEMVQSHLLVNHLIVLMMSFTIKKK